MGLLARVIFLITMPQKGVSLMAKKDALIYAKDKIRVNRYILVLFGRLWWRSWVKKPLTLESG